MKGPFQAESTAKAKASKQNLAAESTFGGCSGLSTGNDRSPALVAQRRGWSCRCKEWLASLGCIPSVHLEIKQGACVKKDFELNGKHPSRLSWALCLERLFSLSSSQ